MSDILNMPFVTQEQKFDYWQASKDEIKKLRIDAERYQWLKNNNATVIKVETEKRGYRSTMTNAKRERWFEFDGWTISTMPVLHESYKTMDEAIDAAMKIAEG